jgi:hypothetical protein
MKPKKFLIEAARANGSIDRMNQLFSAVQILNAQANTFISETAELLLQNGLCIGRLKQLHTNFVRASDNYFKEFASCVFDENRKMDMFNDMDSFSEVFYRWSQLDRIFEPKEITIKKEEPNNENNPS